VSPYRYRRRVDREHAVVVAVPAVERVNLLS